MTKIKSRKFKIPTKQNVHLWDHMYGKDISSFNFKEEEEYQLNLLFSTNLSSYGELLTSKQILKTFYGDISEKYLRLTLEKAKKKRGLLSENFLILLERRLDVVIYRMNFARSIYEAKQFVRHGHVQVNGQKVTICNYEVSNGSILSLTKKGTLLACSRVWKYGETLSNNRKNILKSNEANAGKRPYLSSWSPCVKPIPNYLEVVYGKPWKGSTFVGMFVYTPEESEILKANPFPLNINAVLQFYKN